MEYTKIGNIKIKKTAVLAPMAGVADRAYRILNREFGASYTVSELISAKGLCYSDKKTEELCRITEKERPCALQLFGSEPEFIKKAVKIINRYNPDIIDINMGCPVPKVAGNGEGSALMQNPKLVGEIIYKTARAIKKPVTVKIRKGFSEKNVNAVEIAKIAEANGAAAIAVHGRTREQYYSGKADWDIIRQVKEAVSIPVIGNGDINSPESAKRLIEETGCDGIMIGRAARGNPWIFDRINRFLETGIKEAEPGVQEVKEMILKHARLQIQYKGEYTGMREMRKHVAWYTAGMPHSASVRRQVNEVETYEQLEKLVELF